ncbi:MAG TPA: PEP-CTERM sorting domain-containing protein [Phycisphaerales bacterium]|nr:PEP-CTERM sorting domain-containing protein [Phycisphaerales bacterium]
MDAAGNWSIFITDNAGGDTGTVETISLEFTAVPAPASLALLGLGGLAATRRRR